MLEVGVLAAESPPFQDQEVRLEPVVPLVVLVDKDQKEQTVVLNEKGEVIE